MAGNQYSETYGLPRYPVIPDHENPQKRQVMSGSYVSELSRVKYINQAFKQANKNTS